MAGPQPTLPLDLTGLASSNLVSGEVHTVNNVNGRTIAPDYGAFFTQGLIIRDMARNRVLAPGTDFVVLHLYATASKASNKEVCRVIHFKPHISGDMALTYQAIGGIYSGNVDAIRQLIDSADNLDDRITWGQILYLPNQFKPAAHLHYLGDIFGWEGVIALMEEIRLAVLNGDQGQIDAINNFINARHTEAMQAIDALADVVANPALASETVAGVVRRVLQNTPLNNTSRYVTPDYMRRMSGIAPVYPAEVMMGFKPDQLADLGEVSLENSFGNHWRVANTGTSPVPINGDLIRFRVYGDAPVGDPLPEPIVGHRYFVERKTNNGPGQTWVEITSVEEVDEFGNLYFWVRPVEGADGINVYNWNWDIGARYQPVIYRMDAANAYARGIHSVTRRENGKALFNFTPGIWVNDDLTGKPITAVAGINMSPQKDDGYGICTSDAYYNAALGWMQNYKTVVNRNFAYLWLMREADNRDDPEFMHIQFWEGK